MEALKFDAYSPAQMAAKVEKAGIVKGNLNITSTFTLAFLAGAFISFGAAFYTLVIHDSNLPLGLTKLMGGMVFCLGLILVVVAGAELFTGNNLIAMAYVSRKVSLEQLLRNWLIVFTGNLVGSVSVVLLIWLSGHWNTASSSVGLKALIIANGKVNLSFVEALTRGVLCNILVCLAVWLCFSGRSVTDKILAMIFPVSAFVALGFEHSIANMYFVPAGLLLKSDTSVLASAQEILGVAPDMSNLTVMGFITKNLIPVTLGNIIGGTFFIGLIYWFIYLRPTASEPVRKLISNGPPLVSRETSVAEAVQLMKRYKVGSVLVGEPGNAIGVMSEADVIRKVIAEKKDMYSIQVEQLMHSPVIAVDVKTPLYSVYTEMVKSSIRHIAVTENGKQIGFVSIKSLLRNPIH